MRGVLRRHPFLAIAFGLALAFTVMFAVRLAVSTAIWSDPARIEQPVAGWMTPRYVARSWDVPPEVLAEALGHAMDGTGRRATLEDIARDTGRSADDIIAEVNAAIADWRGRGGD